jgi:phospholipase/carboxylesterase
LSKDTEILETIEIHSGRDPTAAVIWMHGLGADGNDFVPIVDELRLPAHLSIRFVFPHAPMIPVTVNNGYVMRAWYDVSFDGLERRIDENGIRASQRLIENLIERERSRGIPARRIVLAGFSQGGAITLQTGLRHTEALAGLMVLSSYLPLPATLEGERSAANAQVPIFMAHGSYDPVIDISLARRSAARLAQLGYAVQWHDYPMQHSVCAEEIAHIRDWLALVLS